MIADGGCTCPGDVAKGFGGGADFVMLGGMFAGHDEGKGKIVKSNGSKYIEFYGSSSDTANNKHYGGLSSYRSSEGRTVRVKYRGKIKEQKLKTHFYINYLKLSTGIDLISFSTELG